MKPRNQKQVMAGLDLMSGRAIGALAKSHQRDVERPIAAAIGKAKGNKDLLRRLNASLFRTMDTSKLETTMTDHFVQAGLIGRVTAMPRGT